MIVVDASVALKWVLDEDGSARARQLVLDEELAAPGLLWAECANVLWTYVRRKSMDRITAMSALEAIEAAPLRTIDTRSLTRTAQAIAFDLDHTVYDCLYLAAAIAERAVLVTADRAFVRATAAHPLHATFVRAL